MLRLKLVAPLIPYLAVLVGLYGLNSAWASIIFYHLGIIIFLSIGDGWGPGKQLSGVKDYLVLAGVALISALGGLFIFWLWPFIRLDGLFLATELLHLGLNNIAWLLFIFYYFTINPILEEQFWRGYLGAPTLSPVWNDAWFAGYHVLVLFNFARWPWIVISFLVLVGAAWMWRQLARRYNGLIIPIISHAAADASIIGAVFFLVR